MSKRSVEENGQREFEGPIVDLEGRTHPPHSMKVHLANGKYILMTGNDSLPFRIVEGGRLELDIDLLMARKRRKRAQWRKRR